MTILISAINGSFMHLSRIYEIDEFDYRLRYVIRTILRDRIVDGGLFQNCFEMGDGEKVVLTILRRGLRNSRLRSALEGSHVVDLNAWLVRHPEFVTRYQTDGAPETNGR